MKGRIVMMTRTCFTVSKSSTKESGCVAAKSKKVEDHRCHRVCFLLVVRIVRLEKRKLKTILGFGNIKIWTKLVLFFNYLLIVTDKLTLNNVDVFYNLRHSASSFHWLSSSIFTVCLFVRSFVICPASVTPPLISTI